MAKDKVTKKKQGSSRKVSAYNTFIKSEIAKVKKEDPSLSHKDAFKKAASHWANSSANPKKKCD